MKPLNQVYFEFVNVVLQAEYHLKIINCRLIHCIGAMNVVPCNLESREATVRKMLMSDLRAALKSEFRKYIFEDQSYPYELSKDLMTEIWRLLCAHNLSDSFKLSVAKQAIVGHTIQMMFGSGNHDYRICGKKAWKSYEQGREIDDENVLNIFCQYFIDQIKVRKEWSE